MMPTLLASFLYTSGLRSSMRFLGLGCSGYMGGSFSFCLGGFSSYYFLIFCYLGSTWSLGYLRGLGALGTEFCVSSGCLGRLETMSYTGPDERVLFCAYMFHEQMVNGNR
jgi:hypothetical protein